MHYVVWAVFDFLSFFVQSVTELEFLRPSRIVDLVTLSTVHILSLFFSTCRLSFEVFLFVVLFCSTSLSDGLNLVNHGELVGISPG